MKKVQTKAVRTSKPKASAPDDTRGVIELDGFVVALAHVRNVYPVDESKTPGLWEWGFKFTDGFYENSAYSSKTLAHRERDRFVAALREFWKCREV